MSLSVLSATFLPLRFTPVVQTEKWKVECLHQVTLSQKPFKAPALCAWVHFAVTWCSDETWCKVKKQCIENRRILISPWEDLFYVSSLEEFSFRRERQYSWNEMDALKLRGNCERNFNGTFSCFIRTPFSECIAICNPLWRIKRQKFDLVIIS